MTALDWLVVLFVAAGLFMAWPAVREGRYTHDEFMDDLEREYRERLSDREDDNGDDGSE